MNKTQYTYHEKTRQSKLIQDDLGCRINIPKHSHIYYSCCQFIVETIVVELISRDMDDRKIETSRDGSYNA